MTTTRHTLTELESLPTLAAGQADNLKIDDADDEGPRRVWLSRCTVADGEPFDNRVTIERYDDTAGRWYGSEAYPAPE